MDKGEALPKLFYDTRAQLMHGKDHFQAMATTRQPQVGFDPYTEWENTEELIKRLDAWWFSK